MGNVGSVSTATPAAVLARGTRPDSQAAVGSLDGLAALAAEVGEGPAILIIGDVVRHAGSLRRDNPGQSSPKQIISDLLDAAE